MLRLGEKKLMRLQTRTDLGQGTNEEENGCNGVELMARSLPTLGLKNNQGVRGYV